MKQINTKNMHPDEAILELLALIMSVDFNDESYINGSVEFYRGVAEDNGEKVKVLQITNTTLHLDDVDEEEIFTTVMYQDRIETDIPATNEGMKKAKDVIRGYVEGMFATFLDHGKDKE